MLAVFFVVSAHAVLRHCLVGGAHDNAGIHTTECWDDFLNRWTSLPEWNISAGKEGMTVAVINGRTCLLGGYSWDTGAYLDTVECFHVDAAGSKWVVESLTLTRPTAYATALPFPNGVCLAGGRDTANQFPDVNCYSSITNLFTLQASLSFPRIAGSALPLPGGYWCVAGGLQYNVLLKTAECFAANMSSSGLIPLPATSKWGTVVDLQGTPCIIGQSSSIYPICASATSFDFFLHPVPFLAANLSGASTFSYDNQSCVSGGSYVVGGINGPRISTVACYNNTLSEWSDVRPLPYDRSSSSYFTFDDPILTYGEIPPGFSYLQSLTADSWAVFECAVQCTWIIDGEDYGNSSRLQFPPFTFELGSHLILVSSAGEPGVVVPYNAQFTVLPITFTLALDGGTNRSICQGKSTAITVAWHPNLTVTPTLSWVATGSGCSSLLAVSASGMNATVGPVELNAGMKCTVVVNASVPSLSLWAIAQMTLDVSTSPACNLKIDGPNVIPSTSVLRLLANASQANSILNFYWTTPLAPSSPCLIIGIDTRGLVVDSNCLTPGWATFTVLAMDPTTQSTASASVTLFVAGPPSGGACNATGGDMVTVMCTGWNASSMGNDDDDSGLSLLYSLWSVNGSSTPVALSGSQLQSSFSVFLPPGQYNISVEILAPSGASVLVPLGVVILPPSLCSAINVTNVDDGSALSIQQARTAFGCNRSSIANWNVLQQVVDAGMKSQYLPDATLGLLGTAIADWINGASTVIPSQLLVQNFTNPLQQYLASLSVLNISPDIATLVVNSLAQVLSNAPCTVVNNVLLYVAALTRKAANGRVPGEEVVRVSAGEVISTQSSASYGDLSNVDRPISQNVQVALPVLQTPGGIVQTVITDYGNNLLRCRQDGGDQTLLTGISDVVLNNDNGDLMSITNSPVPVVLTFTAKRPPCGAAVCVWWSNTLGEWTPSGCTAGRSKVETYMCTCNHLTEFSLLLAGCPSKAERVGYWLFLILYSITGLIAVGKLFLRIRMDIQNLVKRSWTPMHTQHLIIALLCLLRALGCAVMGQFLESDIFNLRAALLLGPYLLMFWTYTLMIFQWAGLHHFAMTNQKNSFVMVRPLFLLCNCLQCIVIVVLFSLLVTASGTQFPKFAVAMSILQAILTLITASAFSFYAVKLYQDMSTAGENRSSVSQSKGKEKKCCSFDVDAKLLYFGVIISVLLAFQGCLHAVEAVAQITAGTLDLLDRAHTIELILLLCDFLAIIGVLALYHKSMHTIPVSQANKTAKLSSVKKLSTAQSVSGRQKNRLTTQQTGNSGSISMNTLPSAGSLGSPGSLKSDERLSTLSVRS